MGKVLPSAVFGMLVIYSIKDVNLTKGAHGLPELIAITLTVILHVWKRQMFLSIFGETFCYMFLLKMIA